jgi:predicted DNA-binding WGR domain protein
MKRTFIFTGNKSNKFWTIDTAETSFTVTCGEAGTAGQTSERSFSSEADCLQEVNKLIAEKTKKGYVEEADDEEDDVLTLNVNDFPNLDSSIEQFFEQLRERSHDDDHSGSSDLAGLCVANKKYIPLYIRFLDGMDLDHEIGQDWELYEIAEKWGWCAETIPLFAVRYASNPGQHGQENIIDLLETDGAAALAKDPALTDMFLKALAKEYGNSNNVYNEELIALFEAAFPEQTDHERMALRFMPLIWEEKTPTMQLLLQEEKYVPAPAGWHLTIPTTEEEAFETETLPNGSVRITAIKEAYKTRREISFPATIGGAKVEEIGVQEKGKDILAANTSVEKIVIPENVRLIQAYSFRGYAKLPSVHLPNSLRVIDHSAFEFCRALKYIILPNGLETIAAGAFRSCQSLVEMVVPDTVQFKHDFCGDANTSSVFSQCDRLRKVHIPDNWTDIPSHFFCECKSLVDINIPLGLTKISKSTFSSCERLETIVLPDSLREIGEGAFDSCINLKEIVIPEKVCEIAKLTFSGCKSVKEVVIPENIRKIGDYAFARCSNLESITILSPVMVQFSLKKEAYYVGTKRVVRDELLAFKFISPKAVLKVPKALLEEYIDFIEKHPYSGDFNTTHKSFSRIEGI